MYAILFKDIQQVNCEKLEWLKVGIIYKILKMH